MNNPFEKALKDFKVGDNESVQPEVSGLVKKEESPETGIGLKENQEVMDLFGTTRALFDFARDNLPELAYHRYSDQNNEFEDNPYAKGLPKQFYRVISEYPGKFYVVGYENRWDLYYKEGTRLKNVVLSSVKKRSTTDEKIREIGISEYHHSEGRGNVQYLSVKDLVGEKSFAHINEAKGQDLDSSHGSATLVYEVDPMGEKRLIESKFNRLDEGLFDFEGESTPVRWVRRMTIENTENDPEKIRTDYHEEYIIGRSDLKERIRDTRVPIRITVIGNLENPRSVNLHLGLLGGESEILFKNEKDGIIVTTSDVADITKERILEILKNDPNYAFIFSNEINSKNVSKLVRDKAGMLSRDWDKKNHVFANEGIEEKKVLD